MDSGGRADRGKVISLPADRRPEPPECGFARRAWIHMGAERHASRIGSISPGGLTVGVYIHVAQGDTLELSVEAEELSLTVQAEARWVELDIVGGRPCCRMGLRVLTQREAWARIYCDPRRQESRHTAG